MADTEHLKLIQAVITRLAGNSFLLKGWTVTLVAGLSAFAKADTNRSFAWIAVFVVCVFGFLDAYYLALERAYRTLYESRAAAANGGVWTLRVNAPGLRGVLGALTSPPVFLLHGAALAVALAVALSA
jgi:hypothetical protein